jgi:DNA-binding IclR family transcriptional regulator
MQACKKSAELTESSHQADVRHYRGILKQRTRYYLAQRDAGVPALGAAILDLVILANLEGCFMNVESLAEVTGMARNTIRLQVVELIRAGWIDVTQSPAGAGLYASEMAASHAEQWIGIAGAA